MKNKFHFFKTIRMKLLIPIICAIIASSVFVGLVSYQSAANVIIESATGDGFRVVQSMRRYIDLIISTVNLDMSTIIMQPNIKPNLLEGSNAEELENYMRALMDRYHIYDGIIILNARGIVTASTTGSRGANRSDRDYFAESMAGKNFISEVEISRGTGNLVTFISIPVHDEESNSVIGVVMASIGLKELNSRYVAPVVLLGDYGYAMIVNKTGTIIGHRHEYMLGEKIGDDLNQRILSISEEPVAFQAVIDGIPSKLFIDYDHSIDWFPIFICPVNVFFIAANNLAKINFTLTVFVILLLSLIVFLIINGITKALSSAIRYANEVSLGNLDMVLSINRNDEVGVLAQSLRDMVDSLKHMIDVSEQKTMEAEEYSKKIIENIAYASKIQKNLLPRDSVFETAFSDYSVIWKPRDIVGGDLYWAKNFDDGTVLCVCDCTGHGTPGALLTMLVVSAFESLITENNHTDTAEILYTLDHKLATVLNVNSGDRRGHGIMDIDDGCDLAVLFIAKDGNVTISAGKTNVFICDGDVITRIKGQAIAVGEGKIKSKNDIIVHHITQKPGSKFYIASDGLFDQIGGKNSKSFGYKTFKHIIMENHNHSQSVISGKVWDAFEEHRGEQPRRDDLELITFKT